MSDLSQIQSSLKRIFHDEGQRIVFWNDPDKEFQTSLSSFILDDVTTIRFDEVGALEVKNLVDPDDAAADLDRKMIAVVAKADQPELCNIVRAISHAWTHDLTTDYTYSSDKKKINSPSVPIRDIRGSNGCSYRTNQAKECQFS